MGCIVDKCVFDNHDQLAKDISDAFQKQSQQPSLTHCVECDDEIPQQRLKALNGGVKRCACCQTYFDKRKLCNNVAYA